MPVNVTLRKLSLDDAKPIAELANNYEIWINLRDLFPHPYAIHDANKFITSTLEEEPPVTFGLEYRRAVCGIIGLTLQQDVYQHSAEVGYWVGETYWNRGIATAGLLQMIDYASDQLQLKRLFANVYSYNTASIRVLEKCGFRKEGIRTKAVLKAGKYIDDVMYGLTFK